MKKAHQLELGVAFFAAFILIGALALSGVTQDIDAAVALLVNADRGATFTALMESASAYGREDFWIPVVAIMLLFGKRETKFYALELAVLFLLGITAGEVLKSVVFRPHPYLTVSSIVLRVSPDTDSSFPSGHAIIVSIGAGFALLKIRRRAVSLLLTMEAAVVCYSRVYVGMHYPLDVLAGILLAGAIVFIGLFLIERYADKQLRVLASRADVLMTVLHLPKVI